MKKSALILAALVIMALGFTALAEDLVMVDNDKVSVVITGVEQDGDDLMVHLTCKNKTKTTVEFTVHNAVINGCVANPFWADDIPAKKTREETITWYDLSDFGVSGEAAKVEIAFVAYDPDQHGVPYFYEGTTVLYPLGEEAAAALSGSEAAEGTVIMDNEFGSATVTRCFVDEVWGYTVEMVLVNKTDKLLYFSFQGEDATVNGIEVDPCFQVEMPAGSRRIATYYYPDYDLEDAGITEITEIAGTFRVFDEDEYWEDDPMCAVPVVFNP